jgi:hypothetical protein
MPACLPACLSACLPACLLILIFAFPNVSHTSSALLCSHIAHLTSPHLTLQDVACLRIADASVFPWIPSAPPAAAAMAVGAQAAHLILQSYADQNDNDVCGK